MRHAAKVDDNQKDLVAQLRKAGYSVRHTHQIGQGFADIVVGHKGVNFLFEIKDCRKPPSQRKLTELEQKFHGEWSGQVGVVCTLEDVENHIKLFFDRLIIN